MFPVARRSGLQGAGRTTGPYRVRILPVRPRNETDDRPALADRDQPRNGFSGPAAPGPHEHHRPVPVHPAPGGERPGLAALRDRVLNPAPPIPHGTPAGPRAATRPEGRGHRHSTVHRCESEDLRGVAVVPGPSRGDRGSTMRERAECPSPGKHGVQILGRVVPYRPLAVQRRPKAVPAAPP